MQAQLSAQQLQHFKTVLLGQREELQDQLERHQSHSSISSDASISSELAKIDNHLADQATELYEHERDIAFYRAQQRTLSRLNDALNRIDEGLYGVCNVCQKPIPIERLEAVPETATCEEHSPRIEAALASYEYHPFTMEELNLDDQDSTAYDGEDTLQDVLQYGNSSYEEDALMMLDTEYAEERANELVGYCEPLESFLATDITGNDVFIVRNQAYMRYMNSDEGDEELEEL